jgi:hypothetical protein
MRRIRVKGINKIIFSEEEMTRALDYYFKNHMCPYSDFRGSAKIVGVQQINFKQPFTVIVSDFESIPEALKLINRKNES